VSYQYLAQLNGIYNPNYIVVGQTISVPCGPVPYPNYRPSYGTGYPPYQCPWCKPFQKPDNCGATVQYTVQPGDNLFRIAVNNGSTIQWIRTDNDLWGKVLRPGMTLNVPCQNYVHYGSNVLTPGATGQTIVTETPLPTAVPSDRIRMRNGQFNPAQKTVKVGSTVTWFNAEPAGGPAYDINSGQPGQPDGNFTSGGLVQPGGQFQFTFTTAGSYPYFSTTNPTMTGEIIVQP
jgi:plastocyanin